MIINSADWKQTIASERTNAMAWYSHIDGAVQLVKMRGKKQLRTKIGHSLFCCVRTQMVTAEIRWQLPSKTNLLTDRNMYVWIKVSTVRRRVVVFR